MTEEEINEKIKEEMSKDYFNLSSTIKYMSPMEREEILGRISENSIESEENIPTKIKKKGKFSGIISKRILPFSLAAMIAVGAITYVGVNEAIEAYETYQIEKEALSDYLAPFAGFSLSYKTITRDPSSVDAIIFYDEAGIARAIEDYVEQGYDLIALLYNAYKNIVYYYNHAQWATDVFKTILRQLSSELTQQFYNETESYFDENYGEDFYKALKEAVTNDALAALNNEEDKGGSRGI